RDGRPLCAPAYTAVPKFPVKREHGGIWARDDR
ncbi:non-heme iron oxygenase ferredoxin subunit, partial [Xanthomonas hortorum pv. vitians]|nr:non-heme iron oxygenase ferredoxin subunit [Xanthomonas hortorum pv. vitians]